MPIREYQCRACGHRVEVLDKGSKPSNPVCPKCHSQDMKKLLSGFAVGQAQTKESPGCETCPGGQQGGGGCPGGRCPWS